MMLTAEEAKTKWCPFARASGALTTVAPSTVSPGAPLNTWPHCIADGCMAWNGEPNSQAPIIQKGSSRAAYAASPVFFISTSSADAVMTIQIERLRQEMRMENRKFVVQLVLALAAAVGVGVALGRFWLFHS